MIQGVDYGNNQKKYCMVVHAYYPLGETRVEREAHALLNKGYEVDVICLQRTGHASAEDVDGVGVFRLPVSRHKKSGRLIQLLEYLTFFIFASFKLTTVIFPLIRLASSRNVCGIQPLSHILYSLRKILHFLPALS